MRKQLYWLSEAEWKRLKPLLPRGRRGAHRRAAQVGAAGADDAEDDGGDSVVEFVGGGEDQ